MQMDVYPAAWLVFRIAYAWFYLYALIGLFKDWDSALGATEVLIKRRSQGFTILSVAVIAVGGLSILLGIYARLGGLLLLFFNLGGAYIHYRLADQAKKFALEDNRPLVDLAVLGNISSAQKNFLA